MRRFLSGVLPACLSFFLLAIFLAITCPKRVCDGKGLQDPSLMGIDLRDWGKQSDNLPQILSSEVFLPRGMPVNNQIVATQPERQRSVQPSNLNISTGQDLLQHKRNISSSFTHVWIPVESNDTTTNATATSGPADVVSNALLAPLSKLDSSNTTRLSVSAPTPACDQIVASATEPNLRMARHLRISKSAASSRILCVTYSYHKRHDRARAIKETWSRRCEKYLVSSDTDDASISAVAIPHTGLEEYQNMWQKTRATIKYVHDHYRDNYDWFFFAGDDVYVVIENLRAYLASENLTKAIGLPAQQAGHTPLLVGGLMLSRAKPRRKFVFGGSGYVLNRAGLNMFVHVVMDSCHPYAYTSMEDVVISDCMRAHGALLPETSDASGRSRFARFSPHMYFHARIARGLQLRCCSQDLISLHYMQPPDMYWFERFFYDHPGENDNHSCW
jgi:hypothetical protein